MWLPIQNLVEAMALIYVPMALPSKPWRRPTAYSEFKLEHFFQYISETSQTNDVCGPPKQCFPFGCPKPSREPQRHTGSIQVRNPKPSGGNPVSGLVVFLASEGSNLTGVKLIQCSVAFEGTCSSEKTKQNKQQNSNKHCLAPLL